MTGQQPPLDNADHSRETCTDPWCPAHAICGVCRTPVIILDDADPSFCPSCQIDVMPKGACSHA